VNTAAVIDLEGLNELVKGLAARNYRTVGPVVRDGAITMGDIESAEELPKGWQDSQAPGSYRLTQTGSARLFDWAVGPHSAKAEVFPPRSTIWRARPPEYLVEEVDDVAVPVAVIGARPCDLAALEVLDRALDGAPVADPIYRKRRREAFLVVVECTRPASTCFCVSMGTGPGATQGFDLALTELDGRYLARAASRRGRDVLADVPHRPASRGDQAERVALLARAASHMGRSVDTSGLPQLLARNLGNPRWDEVAERCLSCGNCTLVCPTCFCADVKDVSEVDGTIERRRSWASCFDVGHSYLHGGPIRPTTSSRYRQWLTHKVSTWWDQFDTSGCVGCGRCIAWCPVGIDITEEAGAIRATDGAVGRMDTP